METEWETATSLKLRITEKSFKESIKCWGPPVSCALIVFQLIQSNIPKAILFLEKKLKSHQLRKSFQVYVCLDSSMSFIIHSNQCFTPVIANLTFPILSKPVRSQAVPRLFDFLQA